MLKKEFRDALRRFAECLCLLIAVPMGFLVDRLMIKYRWDIRDIAFEVIMTCAFAYAVYAGFTFFSSERKDRAFEYLASLPVSKNRIFLSRIIPRFAFLLVFIAVLAAWKKQLLYPEELYLLFIFLASIFLSFGIESVVIGVFGLFLLYLLHHFLPPPMVFIAWKLGLTSSLGAPTGLWKVLTAVLLLAPFGVGFGIVFHRMDARPLKNQLKPFYSIVLPSVLILLSFILFFYRAYLTTMGAQ